MALTYKDTDPVRLSEDRKSIIILDQTKLPGEVVYQSIDTLDGMYDAIKTLAVRGAPCIGVFAGYCMAVLASGYCGLDTEDFVKKLEADGEYLNSSRPTAVNLSWAVKRQLGIMDSGMKSGISPERITDRLFDEAAAIHEEDIRMCMKIAEQGLSLVLRPKAREYMVEHGYDVSMGARPMRRLIQRDIEDELATLLLSGKRGGSDTVVIDSNGEKLTVRFKKPRTIITIGTESGLLMASDHQE